MYIQTYNLAAPEHGTAPESGQRFPSNLAQLRMRYPFQIQCPHKVTKQKNEYHSFHRTGEGDRVDIKC